MIPCSAATRPHPRPLSRRERGDTFRWHVRFGWLAALPMISGLLVLRSCSFLRAGARVAMSLCALTASIGRGLGVAGARGRVCPRTGLRPDRPPRAALAWHWRRPLVSRVATRACGVAGVFRAALGGASAVRFRRDAIAHRHGWLCFGGAAFVISTAQMNADLLC